MSESQTGYSVIRTDFEDAELRRWWENVYEENLLVRNTFFQSWEWNRSWFDHFVRDDSRRELVLLRVQREGGLVAAVPLFLQKRNAGPFRVWRYFLWIADRLSQYPDLITTELDTRNLWRAVLLFLHGEFPDAWLTLHDVLPESTAAAFMPEGSSEQPGEPYLRLQLNLKDEDAFLQRCVPHMQREIQRTRRLLEQNAQLEWKSHQDPDMQLVEQLISLNIRRFGSASWFADASSTAFFRSLCSQLENELLLSVIMEDSSPVHILACYLHGDTVHYVLSGMDESAKKWSPGTMNIDCCIRWAQKSGYRYFDFLRGDEAYKREFAPEERMSVHRTIPAASGHMRHALALAVQRGRKAVDKS
ncbi:MAG: GNAT family N-acetyltransferase [Bacteroidota bacterium]